MDHLLHPTIISTTRVQAMLMNVLNVYAETDCKLDSGHMKKVFLIRFQQHMEELGAFEFYEIFIIHYLCHCHGRSKIFLKLLKDQSRRYCYMSLQGLKITRGYMEEDTAPSKT